MRTLLLFVAGVLEDTARRLSETLQPCTHETNIAHVERDDGDALEVTWCDCKQDEAMTAATTFLCARRGVA
jgi:hypothetical protein